MSRSFAPISASSRAPRRHVRLLQMRIEMRAALPALEDAQQPRVLDVEGDRNRRCSRLLAGRGERRLRGERRASILSSGMRTVPATMIMLPPRCLLGDLFGICFDFARRDDDDPPRRDVDLRRARPGERQEQRSAHLSRAISRMSPAPKFSTVTTVRARAGRIEGGKADQVGVVELVSSGAGSAARSTSSVQPVQRLGGVRDPRRRGTSRPACRPSAAAAARSRTPAHPWRASGP